MWNVDSRWIFFIFFLESEIKKLIKSKVTKVEEETPNISEKKVDSKKVGD